MSNLVLTFQGERHGQRSVVLPEPLLGRWCEIRLGPLPAGKARAALIFEDAAEEIGFPHVIAPDIKGVARAVLYVPSDAEGLRIELLGVADTPAGLRLSARIFSRSRAAVALFARAPGRVLRAAVGGRAGLGRRVRAALIRNMEEEDLAGSYELWRMLFDHWPDRDIAALLSIAAPGICVLAMCAGSAESAALRATLASLERQARPVRYQAVPAGRPLGPILAEIEEPYVGIVQAGEVLAPHATAVLGAWMSQHGHPLALYADEDGISVDGQRIAPLFKPEPNRALMLSGTLTRGLWLFRRDWLAENAPPEAGWAETLRLDQWLRLFEAGKAGETQHVPFLLTARRHDTESARPADLASVIGAHFDRIGQPARIRADQFPLRVRPVLPDARHRRVTLIVPSALRAQHVRRCVRAVLERTDHDALDLLLVVSQRAPLDEAQRDTLAAIGAHPRLRLVTLPVERFNYAAANNEAVSWTEAEFVCLLNDDVAPVAADWLDAMLGQFADPSVGAAGARLLYDNGTVQHGGIIMGMGGLADHAHRFLPSGEPGYAGRAVLNQELSAVTGACLLVRRDAYQLVGGMDEGFPIAFNDVDFCLKLRKAGLRVVYCADAELVHYESLSLGHHFSGERAALERLEVRRMRERWREAVAADPFHNPNLSLSPGHEWQLAFPPRVRRSDYFTPASSTLAR